VLGRSLRLDALRPQTPKTYDLRSSYALTTLPLRRQEVQTRMRLVAAPTRACTGRRLTFQRRLVTLWAWLMRFPNCGFLPQTSHCCAMTAVDPFRGLDGNFYSTGFGALGTIRGFVLCDT